MKTMMTALLAVCILALGASGAAARSQIDLATGVFVPTHSVEIGRSELQAPGISFALRGSYGLSDRVDLTGRFQASGSGLFGSSVEVYSLTGGGRVFLLTAPRRFRPWLGSEMGWYGVRAKDDGSNIFGGSSGPSFSERDDSFGLNAGGGFDAFVHRRVSLGTDIRYQNAFSALGGVQFVTTMLTVGIHFGE